MDKIIHFRVDKKLYDKLHKRARLEKVNASELLRRCIEEYLEPGNRLVDRVQTERMVKAAKEIVEASASAFIGGTGRQ